ncbi:MAG: acyl--CoA ligase [Oscillospiraceae bacterium]|nr:acyl--CoA ligase [Oscillospiraceae bacterium]
MSRIADAFAEVFAAHAGRTAVIFRDGSRVQRKTYAQLGEDVLRMRSYFAAEGVRQGERILAFATSSYSLCVCMIAALQTGSPIMYVDIRAKQDSLRRIFADYRPDMVLVSRRTQFLLPFFREIGKIRHVIRVDCYAGLPPAAAPDAALSEDTPALLTMTTGSTGKPKIAVRTHLDLLHQLTLIQNNLDAQPRETILTTSYIYIFANLLSGFTTVMPMLNPGRDSIRTMRRRLQLFQHEPVTTIITSPDFCLRADNLFPSLRTLYFGGAILNLHEARQIRRKFAECRCITVYGSTECAVIASADLDSYIEILETSGKSVLGRPALGVEVRLSEDGEILVASQALLAHYLTGDCGKETDSSGTLWHHTGDMAARDGEILTFRGKCGRTLPVGADRLYSNEAEQTIIRTFPDCPKCAVLEHGGKIHVFTQPPHPDSAELFAVLKQLGIQNPVLHRMLKIPCDVKHHTKIHYEKLKGKLK